MICIGEQLALNMVGDGVVWRVCDVISLSGVAR